jgi:hypothetical protein
MQNQTIGTVDKKNHIFKLSNYIQYAPTSTNVAKT